MRVQLLFILLLLIGCDKTEDIVPPEVVNSDEYFKLIDNSQLSIQDSKLLDDGSVVIVGYDAELLIRDIINDSYAALVNGSGELENFKFLNYEDDPKIARNIRVIETLNGNHLISSAIEDSLTFDINLRLVDPSFQTIWNITIGDAENDERGESVVQLPNGDFLLTSSFFNEIPFFDYFLITRISPNGDVIWNKKIDDESIDELSQLVYLAEDNTFLVLKGHQGGSSTIGEIKISKFSIEGEQILSESFLKDQRYFSYTIGMEQLKDGNILVHYTTVSDISEKYAIKLLKLNPNLSLIWEKEINDIEGDLAYDAFETADGSILILSQSTIRSDFRFDVIVTKVDSEGTVLWRKIYGGNRSYYVSNIFEKANSNILITGTSDKNVFTLELNSNGNPF